MCKRSRAVFRLRTDVIANALATWPKRERISSKPRKSLSRAEGSSCLAAFDSQLYLSFGIGGRNRHPGLKKASMPLWTSPFSSERPAPTQARSLFQSELQSLSLDAPELSKTGSAQGKGGGRVPFSPALPLFNESTHLASSACSKYAGSVRFGDPLLSRRVLRPSQYQHNTGLPSALLQVVQPCFRSTRPHISSSVRLLVLPIQEHLLQHRQRRRARGWSTAGMAVASSFKTPTIAWLRNRMWSSDRQNSQPQELAKRKV